MKNKSVQFYNESNTKSFFLHEQLLDALETPVPVTGKNDRIVCRDNKFINLIDYNSYSDNRSMKEIMNRDDWNNRNENLFKFSGIVDDESCSFNIKLNSTGYNSKNAGKKS